MKFTKGQIVMTKAGVECEVHGYCVKGSNPIVLLKTRPASDTWQAIAPEHSLTPVESQEHNRLTVAEANSRAYKQDSVD